MWTLTNNPASAVEWLPVGNDVPPAGIGFGPQSWRSIVECYSENPGGVGTIGNGDASDRQNQVVHLSQIR